MTGASEGIGKGYATAVSMEWVNGVWAFDGMCA